MLVLCRADSFAGLSGGQRGVLEIATLPCLLIVPAAQLAANDAAAAVVY